MIFRFAITLLLWQPLFSQEAKKKEPSPAEIHRKTQERLKDISLYFRGSHIYDQMCIDCHGRSGRGDGPWAEKLKTRPRNFRSGVFKFRTTLLGKLPLETDLRRTIRSGITSTAMPAFTKMSDADLDGVLVFVQSFSKRWKDPANFALPIALPKPPAWIAQEKDRALHAAEGKKSFTQLCASCHGPTGKGNGPAAAGLFDIWKNPIIPADLGKAHHKSGDQASDLYRSIATGLDGTPMPSFSATLKPEEIWNLVAFIKSIEKPE